jgi:RNA polymerase sigma factor (TIGR02999 family)
MSTQKSREDPHDAESKDASGERTQGEVTRLIHAADAGDRRAADLLLEAVYNDLQALARSRLAKERGNTLQTADLVHESYLRLLKNDDRGWKGRAHFFGAAAEAMRRILIDKARRKNALRREGGRVREPLDDLSPPEAEAPDFDVSDLKALDLRVDRP